MIADIQLHTENLDIPSIIGLIVMAEILIFALYYSWLDR